MKPTNKKAPQDNQTGSSQVPIIKGNELKALKKCKIETIPKIIAEVKT